MDLLRTFLNPKTKPSTLLMFGAQVAGFAYAVHKRDKWGIALTGAGLFGTYLSMSEARKADAADITRSLGVAPDETGDSESLGGYVAELRQIRDADIANELAARRARKSSRRAAAVPRRAPQPQPQQNPFEALADAGGLGGVRGPSETSDEELASALGPGDGLDGDNDEAGDLESAN